MQYGFVIDHERCIGCHACTVACKAENDVPVGSFRTWVKYVEKGTYPAIRRHFAVLRCNHCTDAPCVTICPVNALQKRADGIVDVDRDACIGCRACMQACPYDAIYLNDDLGAVEKCHFCAHRVEKGLEPACAVVCPENAIISGDVDDPDSTISRLIRENDSLVRRPEQKTGPNVYYIGALAEALEPGAAPKDETYLWSDRPARRPEPWPETLAASRELRTVFDADHAIEWGWPVALYLVTKGIAAGAAILAPFVTLFGLKGFAAGYLPEMIALFFIAITGFLLVEDLKKPLTFVRLFTRPNWDSWLVKGAWVINGFVLVVALGLPLRALGADAAADAVRWIGAACGFAVAGYTAFLFAQCEGRDLWQSKLLLPHLIAQAVMCGSAVFLAVFWPGRLTDPMESAGIAGFHRFLLLTLIASAVAHLAFTLIERFRRHGTLNATQAAAFLSVVRCGPFRCFRDGLILGVGIAIIIALIFPPVALIPALIGLFMYEHACIRAGQLPPLS